MRVSLKELKETVKLLNSILKDTGYSVKVGERYGYKALDLYNKDNELERTLRAGLSTGEAQDYIFAMMKGIELASKKKKLKEMI